ncbi:MAG: TolB family protein [Caulobacterales bacterium]
MRLATFAATLLLAFPLVADAATPGVSVRSGEIVYAGADGVARALTHGGGYDQPALSPDGHTVAFIHKDGAGSAEENGPTSLWIADGLTGQSRRLFASHPASDVKATMETFGGPVFSLDGGFVYVTADAWATSGAVHQVSVATGAERFVIDGGVSAVIRTGPYRGYLLVTRHMYHPAPEYGSYDPTYVVRPDAKETFVVPGAEKDDGVDHLTPWLKAKGWTAW